MGTLAIGAVVLVRFPFSDLSASKLRPAVVLACVDRDDWILCQITSQSRPDGQSVPLLVADFERGRLTLDSNIRPQRLFTVEQGVILYAAGKIKNTKLQEVKARLRQLFA